MAARSSKVISLSLAKGVLMVVNVVSGMVLARVLTKADYGTYLQTFLAYNFALPILTMGLPQALYYFLPGEKKRQKQLVLENLLLLFGAGLIFSLFLTFGGTEILAQRFNNPDLAKTLKWMIYFPLYTFPVLAGGAVWVTQDKVKLNAIFNVAKGLAITGAVIIAALLTRNYATPTIARIAVPIIFLPVAIYLMFKYVPGNWYMPSIASMWEMAKFSIPLGLATVLGSLTRQFANIVVSLLTSPEEFAIYFNGAREVPLIGIITGSISVVILADMAKYIKQGNYNKALTLFRKAAIISASFLLPVMIFLLIFADSFITILYSNKYEASILPFRIYLFILPVRIVYYGTAFIALGKTKAVLFRSIIELIITAILAYSLTKITGYVGAAIATVTMYYIWAIPYNIKYLGKQFSCKSSYIIPLIDIGKVFFISIIAGLFSVPALLVLENSIIELIVGFFVFGIVYVPISLKHIPELREIIKPLKH